MTPLISVVLPVYKGEAYLLEAIQSILNQTLEDFEILVIIDGSPDNSLEVANSVKDDRVKVIVNKKNLGLIGALNKGFDLAKGKYIARMDQDDISEKDRFEIQYNYLESNPQLTMCGSNFTIFGEKDFTTNFPTDPEKISIELYMHNCIGHPTVMLRNKDVIKYKIRYLDYKDIEDWALWTDVRKKGLLIGNVPESLLRYRMESQSTTEQNISIRKEQNFGVYRTILTDLYGSYNEDDLECHWAIKSGNISNVTPKMMSDYISRLKNAIVAKGMDPNKVAECVKSRLFRIVFNFVDRSRIEGFRFMLSNGLITKTTLKYFLASFKKS